MRGVRKKGEGARGWERVARGERGGGGRKDPERNVHTNDRVKYASSQRALEVRTPKMLEGNSCCGTVGGAESEGVDRDREKERGREGGRARVGEGRGERS